MEGRRDGVIHTGAGIAMPLRHRRLNWPGSLGFIILVGASKDDFELTSPFLRRSLLGGLSIGLYAEVSLCRSLPNICGRFQSGLHGAD